MALAAELIEDRALESAEHDMLRHADLARSLVDLVAETNTPANIALYGRWGSGKSGLANLVKAELAARYPRYQFIRFDAFKYAEAPLRRQFLSQAASALGIKDERFTKGLYRASVTNEVRIPPLEILKTLGLLAVAIAGAGFVWLALLAGLATIGDGPFGERLRDLVQGGAAVALAPATLLAALLAIAGKTFSIERTSVAPSSDEEFEQLFIELVKRASGEKLVIFVDELDRCSAAEVTSTLETIRTFLDVKRCVFIVAADQQVLEQALSRQARHTTPDDPSNPYYSAGSAYLDKIFQYQLEIPALPPRKLTTFALALVRDRGGLWQEIDTERVVSVLIPTHVRSPRRVKRLLNNFALAYRVASKRSEAGVLTSKIEDRASELAKLVCLRTEFPLFATDLAVDARLTRLVLRFVDNPGAELGEQIPARVSNLARLYAARKLPVAALVEAERETSAHSGATIQKSESDDGDEAVATATSDVRTDSEGDLSAVADTKTTYADQLIRYLQKTEHVPGPHRDLIHLESPGADFGLDPEFADQVEADAMDGRTAEVLAQVRDLEPEHASGVIRLLAHRVRESSVGVEGENAVSTLLQVLALLSLDQDGLSDEVAVAIAMFMDRYDLRPEDLPGGLAIGLNTRHPVGTRLVDTIARRPEIESDPALRISIVKNAERLESHREAVAASFAAGLAESREAAQSVSSALVEADLSVSVSVVALSSDALKEHWTIHRAEAADEAAIVNSAAEATYTLFDGFEVAMETFASSSKALTESLATVILALNEKAGRDLVRRALPQMSPIESTELSLSLLEAVERRVISDWPGWLSPLDPASLAQSDTEARLRALALKLWSTAISDDPPSAEIVGDAGQHIARLAPNGLLPLTSGGLVETVLEALALDPVNDASANSLDATLEWVSAFADIGLVDFKPAALEALDGIQRAFNTSVPAQSTSGIIYQYLNRWLPVLLDHTSDAEGLISLRDSAASTAWLVPPTLETVVLLVTRRLRVFTPNVPIPVEAAAINALLVAHAADAVRTAQVWLECRPAPEDIWPAIAPLAGSDLPSAIGDALLHYSEMLSPSERLAIARPALAEALDHMPHQSFYRASRFSEADGASAAQVLIDLYSSATNLDQRERVLMLWRELSPVNADIKGRMLEEIYRPLAQSSVGGFDLAIKYLGLAQGVPEETLLNLIEVLRRSCPQGKRAKLEQRLRDSGLVKRSILERLFKSDREE